jgi:hypothetical protein
MTPKQTELIDIPKAMAALLALYETKSGEPSKLEIVLGMDGAKRAIQGMAQALEVHTRRSFWPWRRRRDLAEAQLIAQKVVQDMAVDAENKAALNSKR